MIRPLTERERQLDAEMDDVANAASRFLPYAIGTAVIVGVVGVTVFGVARAFGF